MLMFKTVNLENKFHHLKQAPFIANMMSLDSEEDKERFNRLVYTRYSGDSLSTTPACDCGELVGEFRLGDTCNICGTECSTKYSGDIQSMVWITAHPRAGKFIIPAVWLMLKEAYKQSGNFDTILYLTDPYYRTPAKVPDNVKHILASGYRRGYSNFVENFDTIIDMLTLTNKGEVPKSLTYIYRLLRENRDTIFTEYLPVPSRTVLVLEKTKSARYFDKDLFPAIDAVILASELGNLADDAPIAKIESKTVGIVDKLAAFFKKFTSSLLQGKEGIFRKHYFAGRLHFSARQVITSNHQPHKADELVIPWVAAVKLFLEHIRSKLLKPPYNMGFNEITNLVRLAHSTHHPLIEKVLLEIIKESPYKGIPCLFSRPPILTRGSIQFFYITDFLRDPEVNVIKISPLVLVMPNAD